ncbi:MAG: hypothetical protein QOF61_735, partial [Acidobacteriota bacterium]|nr:hypothetical protein [Acidobacteriota bacterium]
MKRRTFKAIINAVALVASLALAPLGAGAQEAGGTVSLSNQSGRISVKLERGSRVAISNRYGRITITGWDRDTVEASATSAKGAEAVQVEMTADPQARSMLSLAVVGRNRGNNPFIYSPAMPMPAPRPNPNPAKPPAAPEAEKERANQEMKEKIKEAAKNGVILVPMPTVVVETPDVVVKVPQAPRPAQPTPGAKGIGTGSGSGAGTGGGTGVGGGMARAGGEDTSITLDVKVPRYA